MEEKEETDENERNIARKGDHTLPKGWKMTSEGESGMQGILSPDGKMYRSRKLDVHDMIQKGDDTVPAGWKMRNSEGESGMQGMLSPDGDMYRSRKRFGSNNEILLG